MKKTFKALLISLVAVLLLTACGGGGGTEAGESKAKFSIGLVLDMGGVDDKSFNQSSWEGVKRFGEEFGYVEGTDFNYLSASDDTDYVRNLTEFAKDGKDVVIAVGYLFEKALEEVAPKFPDTTFLFIDGALDPEKHPNVVSTSFAQEQGSFLVGLIAGNRAKEDGSSVAFMGGMEGDAIGAFQAGFEQGVKEASEDVQIFVEYADTFEKADVGQSIAKKMYDQGVSILYHAAGNVGNGAIKEAQSHDDKWVIGVDRDQYDDGKVKKEDDAHSVVLTSMVKRVDEAAYQFLKEYHEKGKVETQMLSFNLENNGIGAEVTEGRNLSADEIKLVEEYTKKIVDGEIEVSPVPSIPNKSSNK